MSSAAHLDTFTASVCVAPGRKKEFLHAPCPCHLAHPPFGAKGWYCNRCYSFQLRSSWPEQPLVDYTHEQAIEDGTTNPRKYMVSIPDYYFITRGNTLSDELAEHFDSS